MKTENWTDVSGFADPPQPGQKLAEFLAGLQWQEVPDDVRHQAKRVLLEGISWLFLGNRREQARQLPAFIESMTQEEKASVAGLSRKTDAGWAAFANGYFCQTQMGNDGQREASVYGGSFHPGRVIMPSALAMAEAHQASGPDLLCAMIAGYEVAYRVRGLSPRPPAEAYAAAAAAAKILQLGPASFVNAMAISGYNTSRVTDAAEYNAVNFLTTANVAKVGIESACMAAHGFPAPPFEDDSRFSHRFENHGLGKHFGISQLYLKPYLGCRLLQGAIDAALDFRANVTEDNTQIASIRVHVITEAAYTAHHVQPDSYYIDCQLSLPYCAACALIDGDVGEAQFTQERIASEDVQHLHRKIEVVLNESLDAEYPEKGRPTIMEVKMKDGRVLRHERRYDKGEPENPLSDAELKDKFCRWAGPDYSQAWKEEVIEAAFAIEEAETLDSLTGLLRKSTNG